MRNTLILMKCGLQRQMKLCNSENKADTQKQNVIEIETYLPGFVWKVIGTEGRTFSLLNKIIRFRKGYILAEHRMSYVANI